MLTRRLIVDRHAPDAELLRSAADVLASGGLVAFPTETVYGLGALALDESAVARIFAAKGRPATNPLIVHVADVDAAKELAAEWPEVADLLAQAFWPGPLSLVVAKRSSVPDATTAGGSKVALRIPGHPVALALLQTLGRPLAAPSANQSNAVSPTTAEHVLSTLDGRIEMVIDAGPCDGGLESTVVDVTEFPPRLLRPGLISPAQLAEVLGVEPTRGPSSADGPLASPGLLAKHYSPRAAVDLAHDDGRSTVLAHLWQGVKVGWVTRGKQSDQLLEMFRRASAPGAQLYNFQLPETADGFSSELYATLHDADAMGLERIVVAELPDGDEWLAVRDRLTRAAAT